MTALGNIPLTFLCVCVFVKATRQVESGVDEEEQTHVFQGEKTHVLGNVCLIVGTLCCCNSFRFSVYDLKISTFLFFIFN